MLSFRILALISLVLVGLFSQRGWSQGALLLEEPYGIYGMLNPTGHTAVYFEHICADSPLKLRRCHAGEPGSVISRYQGIKNYDWVAIPLIPYLYSVENASDVPERVTPEMVGRMRDHYREAHLTALGRNVRKGGFIHGGWTELIGISYERRVYAFRFSTTREQDDRLIARLNGVPNKTHFNMLYNNCADFARKLLNMYYPGVFKRNFFPDAGITTPKHVAFNLTRYTRKHPEAGLGVYEIPQIPGYRRCSRTNKNISETLVTTVDAIPLAAINPYLAGSIFADYFVHGRYRFIPKQLEQLGPDHLGPLTAALAPVENPTSAGLQAASSANALPPPSGESSSLNSSLRESMAAHE
jgi:hypothetical protein